MIYKVTAKLNEAGLRYIKNFHNGGDFTYQIKLMIDTEEIKTRKQRRALQK